LFYKVDMHGPASSGTVGWEVVPGSSGPSLADFVGPTSGTLNFSGPGAQTVSVTLKTDPTQPPTESFTIELLSPTGGVLGTNSAIVQSAVNLTSDGWKAGSTGDWSTTSNWTSGVPGSSTQASIAVGGVVSSTIADNPVIGAIVTARGATLDVTAGSFTAVLGTGTGVHSGAIVVADGSTLVLGGTFRNAGSITLNGSTDPTLLELDASLTLSGGGKIILSNSVHNAIFTDGSAATLTNSGNTISGAGTIGDANLTLVNKGTARQQDLAAAVIDGAAEVDAGDKLGAAADRDVGRSSAGGDVERAAAERHVVGRAAGEDIQGAPAEDDHLRI